MCQSQNCECHKGHKSCNFKINIMQLLQNLERKGTSYLPLLQKIRMCYEETIKALSRERDKVGEIMNQAALNLSGNEAVLYYLMKSQRQEDKKRITCALISNVGYSTANSPTIDITQQQTELDLKIRNFNFQIESALNDIQIFLKQKIMMSELNNQLTKPIPFCFSANSSNKTMIFTNKNTIIGLFGQEQQRVAFIEPSLKVIQGQNYHFEFKILHVQCGIYLGIGHKKIIQDHDFKWTKKIGEGIYAINSYGNIYSQTDQKWVDFTFSSGHIVSVIFNKKEKSITFENKDSKIKTTTINFEEQKESQFYLCVITCSNLDTVELLSSKVQQPPVE